MSFRIRVSVFTEIQIKTSRLIFLSCRHPSFTILNGTGKVECGAGINIKKKNRVVYRNLVYLRNTELQKL
jgi:hypothetical protein